MMNEKHGQPMNVDRLRSLADSYGGDMARWPIADRGAARLFAILNPISSRIALGPARDLDRLLGMSRELAVSPGLYKRISRDALAMPERGAFGTWLRGAWLGAVLAAACAAGIATGIVFTPGLAATSRAYIGADPVEDAAAALREPTDLGEA